MNKIAFGLVVCQLAMVFQVSAASGGSAAEGDAGRVDEILTKLERRSDGLRDIQTSVVFVDDDQINLSRGEKRGRILFWMTDPNPHFLIHFERTEMDGMLGKQEWYLFDGRWLYQGVERLRQVTKQEMAEAGEKLDLFDLERTPFPLPFGQKKDKILANFNVTLALPTSGDPADTDHLLLVPKPTSRLYRKYDRVDLYVHGDVHLPTRIVVMKNDGMETVTADFPDLSNKSINTGVTERDFAKPAAWEGYKVVVEKIVPGDR